MYRILVVEDERPINDLIEMNLTEAGYSCVCAYDGLEAANLLEKESFDLVLLDIMLPKVSGYELLDFIKPLGIPVIFLTAKGTMADKVKGLRLGADDYLPQPFAMGELLARVRAMLRRVDAYTPGELSFADLVLDRRSSRLSSASGAVTLTRLECRMLEALLLNRGACLSTEELLVKVWGYETETEPGAVWVYVYALRRRLAAVGSRVRIRARRGVGYTLEADDD